MRGNILNWLAHVFMSNPDIEFRLGNLLADIALVAVDPRVDFSSVAAE